MKGYLNRPEETRATLRDGWLYTGDIATMDSSGYFYIVDRKRHGHHRRYECLSRKWMSSFDHPKVAEAITVCAA